MNSYVYQAIVTVDEDGAYNVEFPALPGCFTFGDSMQEAAEQAVDAASTYVAALLKDGLMVPEGTYRDAAPGETSLMVAFSTDESYIVEGEVVSAAEAARRLGVSAGRVSHMIASGILSGYRKGRRTYVTLSSIEARLKAAPAAGRPRKAAVA
jgi:predicted RNase H-like HicB family nuclease